jgi:hypothetical protein
MIYPIATAVEDVGENSSFDNEPITERWCHKQLSIRQLVAQLSDSAQRVQDSISVTDTPAAPALPCVPATDTSFLYMLLAYNSTFP